jgi:hypothetical protein
LVAFSGAAMAKTGEVKEIEIKILKLVNLTADPCKMNKMRLWLNV